MNAMLAVVPEVDEYTHRDPDIHVIEVSPELAQIWLGLNTANRKLKPHAVAAYAADMKAGRWALNGDAIRFAGSSTRPRKLLDGQNRLHAVMKAGVTVRMLVMFDIDEHLQITMDSGAKRTVADNLQITGARHTTNVAAAATLALLVETGRLAGGSRLTNATIQAFIDENYNELERSADIAAKYARRADVAPAIVTYTHWIFCHLSPADADAFWRDAAEKVGLSHGDPVIALTNLFSEARRNRRTLDRRAQLSVIYRAWNDRRAGRTRSILKVMSAKGGLITIPEPR